MKRLHLLATPLVAALLLLPACGGQETGSTVGADAEFNAADVAFATQMISHHAEAVAMADLTMRHNLDPKLQALAVGVREEQTPEIETMVDWLQDWDQPVPETMRDHANAEDPSGMDMGDEEMPGMMSREELGKLKSLDGDAFEERWLEMMIEHHKGALEMAETEAGEGKYPAAVQMAEGILVSQTAEIEEMERMLAS